MQTTIDQLTRMAKNAHALNLMESYYSIMVALGGRMMECYFGRKH